MSKDNGKTPGDSDHTTRSEVHRTSTVTGAGEEMHRAPVLALNPLRSQWEAERDIQDGRVLREIANLRIQQDLTMAKVVELDNRIDKLADNHATLSTSLVSAAQMANRGGLFAAGGGSIIGIYELAKAIGHALGYW